MSHPFVALVALPSPKSVATHLSRGVAHTARFFNSISSSTQKGPHQMKRRPPPHLRPDAAQRAAVRAELHGYVDRAVDDWPAIEAEAGDGIIRGSGVAVHTSEVSDPTGNAAVNRGHDPGQAWLAQFRAFQRDARYLDAKRAELAPAKPKRGRENDVRVCAMCKQPNPKMHVVDDKPYCASSCYYVLWRARRANAANG